MSLPISDCRLPIEKSGIGNSHLAIGNWQSAILTTIQ